MAKDEKGMAHKSDKDAPDLVSKSKPDPSEKSDSTVEAPATDSDRSSNLRWSTGSWRGKASAVAEVARESISAPMSTPDRLESAKRRQSSATSSSSRLSKSFRTPSKSSPSAASTTRLSVSTNAALDGATTDKPKGTQDSGMEEGKPEAASNNQNKTSDVFKDKEIVNQDSMINRPVPAVGWRGWWSRPASADLTLEKKDIDKDKALGDKRVTLPPSQLDKDAAQGPAVIAPDPHPNTTQAEGIVPASMDANQPGSRTSWFGLWGSGQADVAGAANAAPQIAPKSAIVESSQLAGDTRTDIRATSSTEQKTLPELAQQANASSVSARSSGSWAFWSREKPKDIAEAESQSKEQGELAVAGTPSQSAPKITELPTSGSEKSRKRERPESSSEPLDSPASKKPLPAHVNVNEAEIKDDQASDASEASKKSGGEKSKQHRTTKPTGNLVLPRFKGTYHVAETPSYLQQLFHVISRKPSEEIRHLSIAPAPLKIRKALAIGVHGYFPAPLIQKVIGQPTGTSVRFANGAATAIQKWTEQHGYSCEIEKVALEGEGMIGDRVDTLWKLLLNWIDQIRKADFLMVACHSQGVPVAVMLVAKLINFGCLSNTARVGICGMAGINLGPFPSYSTQSRLFGPSANELFEFSRPESTVFKAYSSALELVLAKHVRLLYVGSIDDQLVPLESSIFANVSHPYIYRAVFVDGRIHAPDFLTHLVGFALKLRNLGVSDHGLIRELSTPLAGSLYGGEGHSRIYEEPSVYDLAVEFTLETSELPLSATMDLRPYEIPSTANSNPYFLPWALRGLLEEEFVRQELANETKELLRLFESWKPSSKVLKDVKFRLEAVKSKL